jgi:hypothetical protein
MIIRMLGDKKVNIPVIQIVIQFFSVGDISDLTTKFIDL